MKKNLICCSSIAAFLAAAPGAFAATYTWDSTAGGGAPVDGTGTWTTGTNWWNGVVDSAWTNLNTDTAVFGAGSGTAGAVTVGAVTVNGLTFNAAGSGNYTLSSGTITLAGTTPTITSNVNASIGSILAGTAGLTTTGTGTLTLTGTNTYSGATTIGAGKLQIGNGVTNGAIGSGTASIAGGATLQFNRNTVAAPTWGSIIGAGTLELTTGVSQDWGTSYLPTGFTGTLQIDSGRVSTNATGSVGNASTVIVGSGGQFAAWNGGTFSQNFIIAGTGWGEGGYQAALRLANAGGTTTLSGSVTLAASTAVGASGTGIFTGVISGSNTANLTIGTSNMAGAIVLQNANTFSGNTTVAYGTLILSNSAALQNSTVTIGGIAFGSAVASHAFTLGGLGGSGNLALTDAASNPVALTVGNNNSSTTYSGALSGSGSLVKTGTGTFTLSGSNSYTGSTTISNGTLVASGTTSTLPGYNATGKLSVAGGAGLTVSAGGANWQAADIASLLTNASFASNSTLGVDTAANTVTYSSNITNSGIGLTKLGTGTLILTGSNTYSGLTNIGAGTLQLGTGGTTGSLAPSSTIVNNGTLIFNRLNSVAQGTDFSSASITGTGALTQTGTANLILSSNSYTGTTTATSGTLELTGTSSGGGSFLIGPGSAYTTVFKIDSGASLTVNSGNQIQAGSNYPAGSGGTALNSAGTVNNAGTLYVGRGTTLSLTSGTWTQSGAGSVNQQGGYGASMNVSGGTFAYTNGTAFGLNNGGAAVLTVSGSGLFQTGVGFNSTGGGGVLTLTGGTFQATANIANLNTTGTSALVINLGAGGGVIDTQGFSVGLSTPLSSTGSLTKLGTGTLTLGGSNTYSGSTTVSSGTLILTNSWALQNSTLTTGGSGLVFGSSVATHAFTFGALSGSTALGLQDNASNPVALTVGGNNASTSYSGALSGSGSLTKSGTGTLILSGSNSYSGGTTIGNGAIQFAKVAAMPVTGAIVVNSGAGLSVNAGGTGEFASADLDTLRSNLSYSGSLSFGIDTTNSTGGNLTYASNIGNGTGTLGITKLGTGSLTLSGSNSFSGGTAVTGGTLVLANVNALQNSTLNLAGGTLGFDSSVSSHGFSLLALTGSTGVVLQDNAGTPNAVALTLGGNNSSFSYSGALSGPGSLVKTGTGTLILTGSSTYSGPTTISGGTLQVGDGASLGGALGSGTISSVSGANLVYNFPSTKALTVPLLTASSFAGNLSVTGGGSSAKIYLNGSVSTGGSQVYSVASGPTGISLNSAAVTLTASSISMTGDVGRDGGSGNTLALDTSATNGPINLNICIGRGGIYYSLNSFTANAGTGAINWAGPYGNYGNQSTPITLTGGVITISSNLYCQSGQTLTLNPSAASTVSGALSGAFSLAKGGVGTLTMSGSNSYSGATTVSSGTLLVASIADSGGSNLGYGGTGVNAGVVLSATGTLELTSGTSTTARGFTFGGGTIQTDGASSLTLTNGVASAITGTLTKKGTGTLVLAPTATTGSVYFSVQGGEMDLSGTTNAQYGGITDVAAGALVKITGSNANMFYIAGNTNSGINFATGAGGTVDLNGFNTSVQQLATTSGTLSTGVVTNNSATTDATLSVGTQNQTNTYGGALTDGTNGHKLGLTKLGTGTETLVSPNTFTGLTTISAGSLQLGVGGTTGSLSTSSTIVDNGTLVFNRLNTVTQGTDFSPASITGTGGITQSGSANLILSSNSYTGTTLVSSGSMELTGTSTGGGNLSVGPGSAVTAVFQIDSGASLTGSAGNQIQIGSGAPAGYGGSTLISAGTVNNAGTLFVGRSAYLGITSGTWTQSGAAGLYQQGGYGETMNVSGGTFAYTSGTAFGINYGGSASLIVSGSGVFQTGVGFSVPSGGNLTLTGGGTLQATAAIANLNTTGTSTMITQLGTGGGVIDTQGFSVGLSTPISNVSGQTGSLTKLGTGSLTLGGSNTYSGSTTVTSGTLILTNSWALQNSTLNLGGAGLVFDSSVATHAFTFGGLSGTTALALQDNAANTVALTVGGNNASTSYSGALSGAGSSLVKTGTGALTLAGSNSYSGGTTVANGTLQFAKTASMPVTGAIVVNSGAGLAVNAGGPGEFASTDLDTLLATASFSGNVSLGIDTTNAAGGNFAYASNLGNVGGTLAITKLGAGSLTLSGSNSYTGATTIGGGRLVIGSPTALGSSAVTVNGGALDFNGYMPGNTIVSVSGTLANSGTAAVSYGNTLSNGTRTFTVGGTGDIALGSVTGGATLIKTGNDTLTLGGSADNNALVLNVNGGTVVLNKMSVANHAVAGGLTLTSGTVQLAGTGGDQIWDSCPVALNGGVFDLNGRSESIGVLSGSAGGVITNSSTTTSVLTLTGSANFGGSIRDGAGSTTLILTTGANILSGSSSFTGASALYSGSLILANTNALQNSTLTLTPSGLAVYFDSSVSSHAFTIGALANTAACYINLQDNAVTPNPVTLTVGGNNGSTTFLGNLLGLGSLVKTGTGTFTLTGINMYAGTTTVANGTLAVSGSTNTLSGYNLAGKVSVASGATLSLLAGGTAWQGADIATLLTNASFASNSTLAIDTGANTVTCSGNTPSSGLGLTKLNTGTLILAGTNSYTGPTTIGAGVLQLGAGGATGSLSGSSTIVNNGALVFNRGNTVAQGTDFGSAAITGTGSLTQSGSGTVILTSNSYTGDTVVNSGSMELTGTSSGGGNLYVGPNSSATAVFKSDSSATLNVSSGKLIQIGLFNAVGSYSSTLNSAGTVNNAGTLTLVRYSTLNITSGTWTQSGPAAVDQMGGYNATMNVSGGTFAYTNGTAFGLNYGTYAVLTVSGSGLFQTGVGFSCLSGGVVTLTGGGTLQATATIANLNTTGTSGLVTSLGTGGGVIDTQGFTVGLSTPIANVSGQTGSLTKTGTGTLTLGGSNSYSGGTTVSNGTLQVGNANALGTGGLTVNAGTLDLNGNSVSVPAFSGAGGSVTSTVSGTSALTPTIASGASTYAGSIADGAGTVALTKLGTGTLILTGSNSFTGAMTISAGALQLGTGGATGSLSGSGTIVNNGALIFNRSNTVAQGTDFSAAAITGTGTLTQSGSGNVILSSNAYTGDTTVNSGSMELTGASTGGGNVYVAAGNSLPGTFKIDSSASLTVSSGKQIQVGNAWPNGGSPATLTSAGTVNNAGTLYFGRYAIVSLTSGTWTQSGPASLNQQGGYGNNITISGGAFAYTSGTAFGINNGTGANLTLSGSGLFQTGVGFNSSGGGTINMTGGGTLQATANITNLNTTGTSALVMALGTGGGVIDTQGFTVGLSTPIANVSGQTGSLTKTGAGTLILSGSSTYSGGTTVNNGTLQAGNAKAFGTGDLTVNAGTVDLNGNGVNVGALSGSGGTITNTAGSAGTLTTTVSGTSTYAGNMIDGTGTVTLNESGAGTLILSGSIAMSGLNANSGATQLTQSGSIGAVNIASGASLSMAANTTGARSVLNVSSLTISGFTSSLASANNTANTAATYTAVEAVSQPNAGVLTDTGLAVAQAVATSAIEPASPEAVPEPGTLGLLLAGALGLLGFRRNKQTRG